DRVYSTWPQDALARWSEAQGIKAINMCPDFRELSKTTFPLYWAYDGHWLPRGHQLAADLLARNLEPYLTARVTGGQESTARPAADTGLQPGAGLGFPGKGGPPHARPAASRDAPPRIAQALHQGGPPHAADD